MSAIGVFFCGSFLLFLLGFEYLVFIFLQVYVGGIAVLFGCSLFFLTPNLPEFSVSELVVRGAFQLSLVKFFFTLQHSVLFTFLSSHAFTNNQQSELLLLANVFNYYGYIVAFLSILLLFGLIVVIGLFSNQTSKI